MRSIRFVPLLLLLTTLTLLSPSLVAAQDDSRNSPTGTGGLSDFLGTINALLASPTANDMATAFDIPAGTLVSASLGSTDASASAIVTHAMSFFPTGDGSFALMSTGDASLADDVDGNADEFGKPTIFNEASVRIAGWNNPLGNDMARIIFVLTPPTGTNSLSFDFAFYSEEWPDYVGTPNNPDNRFSDAFIAELGAEPFSSQIAVSSDGLEINSPANFALDPNGLGISARIGLFGFDPNVPNPNTGTTYDGTTGLLKARACLPEDLPTGNVVLVLTVTDMGLSLGLPDNVLDSAVFFDNFKWSAIDQCGAVKVPQPGSMEVTKSTNVDSVNEPGGPVTFTVEVENTGPVEIFLTSLSDSVYGDLNGKGDCAVPQTIPVGESYSCSFTENVTGQGGDTHRNVVTANVLDPDDNQLQDTDDATVSIENVGASLEVTKQPDKSSISSGETVTFTVTVKNTSAADTVKINSLVDNVYGDLNGQGTCAVGAMLAPGESYICAFSAVITGDPGSDHFNQVTATGEDDDKNPVEASGSAKVSIKAGAGALKVTKTPSVDNVSEAGGMVHFTVNVENTGNIAVNLTGLSDSVYGDLNGQGECAVPQTINPGSSYGCTFSGSVQGAPGATHFNEVTASGTDANNNAVSGSASASVGISDAPSSLSVSKSANPTTVPHTGGLVTFTIKVTNTSATDTISITSLSDNAFGDLNGQGSCAVGAVLAPNESYECSFAETVTGDPGSTHVNTATAAGIDDDNQPVQGSDSASVAIEAAPPPICESNPGAHLKHSGSFLVGPTFDLGRVVNLSDACSYDIGIASYKKFDEVIDHQELYNSQTRVIGPGETVELGVVLPDCNAQVDLFFGPVLPDLNGKRYGSRLLDAEHLKLGAGYCQQQP